MNSNLNLLRLGPRTEVNKNRKSGRILTKCIFNTPTNKNQKRGKIRTQGKAFYEWAREEEVNKN